MVSDEEQIIKKLDVYLEEVWLKYLLQLLKVDGTSAFFINEKYFERRQDESEDECMRLSCCDYM